MADRLDAICGIKNEKTDKTYWTKVGVAFPSRSGGGWSLFLDYIPMQRNDQGKMSILLVEPKDRDSDDRPPPRRDHDDDRPSRRARDEDRPARDKNMDDEIPFFFNGFVPYLGALITAVAAVA